MTTTRFVRDADAETGERGRFSSAALPRGWRRSPKISEVLLRSLGSAAGLSPAAVTRLAQQ
ncbi:hypothetical protein GCM10010302_41740 [Streptomyces polychromogenes]|uniref:Uncharacterized protein n=1 Tax=Streptomyces polychromogenes TaxID=67342 RepID=A0ABN0VGW7_9ACTN